MITSAFSPQFGVPHTPLIASKLPASREPSRDCYTHTVLFPALCPPTETTLTNEVSWLELLISSAHIRA